MADGSMNPLSVLRTQPFISVQPEERPQWGFILDVRHSNSDYDIARKDVCIRLQYPKYIQNEASEVK